MKKFWKKNEKRIKRSMIWFIVALFLFFVVPIMINWVYKSPAQLPIFAMDWHVEDVLSFYGSILGAVATIIALKETISFTRESQKEERILSIKPYLETRKYGSFKIKDISDNDILLINVHRGIITHQGVILEEILNISELQKCIIQHVEGEDLDQDSLKEEVDVFFQKRHILIYEIRNCGAGNAIDVEFAIGDITLTPKFCISTDNPKRFIFVFNDDLLVEAEHRIRFSIIYSDIDSSVRYCQKENFLLQRNGTNELQTVQLESDLLTAPEKLT